MKLNEIPTSPVLERVESAHYKITPLRHAIEDSYYTHKERPIDCNWYYSGLTNCMNGFNPIQHIHHIAKNTALNDWLQNPKYAIPEPGDESFLLKETMTMTHDYLHSWSYRALHSVAPDLGVGSIPITKDNIEFYTFIHLLTEAVACVGLDYWYLCNKDAKDEIFQDLNLAPMTTHYRESDIEEYRKFNSTLEVQTPDFFKKIVEMYTTDTFEGFDLADLKMNENLSKWISSELYASRSQRYITRLWLSNVGGFQLSREELMKPVAKKHCDKVLTEKVGNLLWKKIKDDESLFYAQDMKIYNWKYNPTDHLDFRIYNLSKMDKTKLYDWSKMPSPNVNFSIYMQQYISYYVYPLENEKMHKKIAYELPDIRRYYNQKRLWKLMDMLEPVEGSFGDTAPLEMIFQN